VDGLRKDQLRLLDEHRTRSLEALLTTSARYTAQGRLRESPEGAALLSSPRALLVSACVSAAAAAVEVRRRQQERADESGLIRIEASDLFPLEVLDTLKRRRLPFAPEDVEFMLDLGASTMRADDPFARSFETLSFAVSAASPLLREHPGSPPVLAALERAVRAVDALGLVHTSDPGKLVQRMRALIAAHVPGGLLDLSVVDLGDAWGERAAEALRRHTEHWVGVPALVALLAQARGTRPTQAWLKQADDLAASYDGYGGLVRDLLEPILEIELVGSGVPWPPVWLLTPANEVLARGATWATADVHARWVVPLLGQLALRCAAPSPHPAVTTALSHAVASGAVEALALVGTDEARTELRVLLGEIRRRDLLKRVAALVEEAPEDTAARDERIRREKRRDVQRKASLEPKERQRLASAYVRRELAPVLRAAGFDDSASRTFWRALEDRVERVHCKAHAGGLTLELGIWFLFVPRWYAIPEKNGRLRPSEYACDLRGNVHAWHGDLASAAAEAEAWFGRWRPLPVVLRWLLEGASSEDAFHWGAPGSPVHATLVGYLAKQLGEDTLTRQHLARVVAHYAGNDPSERSPEWDAWLARVREDARS
jgi:hypothetical protein